MADIQPPFTKETAQLKLKFAQGLWNTRDPERIVKGYTADCIWRNRDVFIQGTDQILAFLAAKWNKEKNYRLRKELFCVGGDHNEKIAVQFWYEYQDAHDGMKLEKVLRIGSFDQNGKMKKRMMSGNDVVLGIWGSGEGVAELGIEGRWFKDGVDLDADEVTKLITSKHY